MYANQGGYIQTIPSQMQQFIPQDVTGDESSNNPEDDKQNTPNGESNEDIKRSD